jgi:hypothetical protein
MDERQPLLNGASEDTGIDVSKIVGWDSPEDAENPRNWSLKEKSWIVLILTAITILSYIL